MPNRKGPADEMGGLSPRARQFVEDGMTNPPEDDADKGFLGMMTMQRRTRLLEIIDNESLFEFFTRAKPKTLQFLQDLRDDEVKELGNAIENARAFRRGGKILRWGIVTLFGTFMGMTMIWDKVSAWLGKGVK